MQTGGIRGAGWWKLLKFAVFRFCALTSGGALFYNESNLFNKLNNMNTEEKQEGML